MNIELSREILPVPFFWWAEFRKELEKRCEDRTLSAQQRAIAREGMLARVVDCTPVWHDAVEALASAELRVGRERYGLEPPRSRIGYPHNVDRAFALAGVAAEAGIPRWRKHVAELVSTELPRDFSNPCGAAWLHVPPLPVHPVAIAEGAAPSPPGGWRPMDELLRSELRLDLPPGNVDVRAWVVALLACEFGLTAAMVGYSGAGIAMCLERFAVPDRPPSYHWVGQTFAGGFFAAALRDGWSELEQPEALAARRAQLQGAAWAMSPGVPREPWLELLEAPIDFWHGQQPVHKQGVRTL